MITLYFSILLCCIGISYISKRKLENILWGFCVLITWFLCVFVNSDYVDWQSYQMMLARTTQFSVLDNFKDIGFSAFLYMINVMGLPAIWMRIIIFSLGFILTHISLNRLGVNKLAYLLFYAIYPLTSDTMHLRTYIVSFVLLYAISGYVKDKKLIKYIIFIIVAALFHKMAIFYIFMPLIHRFADKSKLIKRLIFLVVIMIIIVGSNRELFAIITNKLVIIGDSINLGNYTNMYGAGIRNGWIVDWTCQLLCTFLIYFIWMKSKKNHRLNSRDEEILDVIYWCNIYAVAFLPFYLISFDYFRLYRCILPLNYIAFSMFIESYSSQKRTSIDLRRIIAFMVAVIFVISLGYVKVTYRGRGDEEFVNYFYNEHITTHYQSRDRR